MNQIQQASPKYISRREWAVSGLIFALAALMIAPTLWYGLACSPDGHIHFYRIVHMIDNVRHGAPFLQWGEHFMRGYGYPIYAFYAPLTYWGSTGLSFLGLSPSFAFRLFAWLTLFVGGWGAYHLGRRYFSPNAAFVTGLAYLFAPYFIFDAVQRGAVPETLGLALLPWALVAADLAMVRRSPRAIALASALFALVVLSHNVIPNMGFLILLFLAMIQNQSWKNPRLFWQSVRPAVLIIVLALGLSAFFWLPAFIELGYTATRNPVARIGDVWPDFETSFLHLDKLIGWPVEPADKGLTNPPFSQRFGPGQFVLALIGLLSLIGYKHPRRRVLVGWGIIMVVSLFMTTVASRPLWLYLPLPDFVQLPARFLGPATLAAALLVGIPVNWVSDRWWDDAGKRRWVVVVTVAAVAVVVVVSGWPWLYTAYCEPPVEVPMALVADKTRWTEEGVMMGCGGECLGEVLPGYIEQMPALDGVFSQYEAGGDVNRLLLPETAVLQDWQHAPARDVYQISMPTSQAVTYQAFYFPGWQARLNGEPVSLQPTTEGLIQFTLPQGESSLVLWFGPTPLRWATLFISGMFAISLLWWGRRRGMTYEPEPTPTRRTFLLWLAVLLMLGVGRVLVERVDSPIRMQRLQNGRFTGADVTTEIKFNGEFMHLGISGIEPVVANEPFELIQYWGALRDIGAPYDFQMQIADDSGQVWNLPYTRPPEFESFPGKPGWLVDHYARDAYLFELQPGTPPGDYWVEAYVYRKDVDLSLLPRDADTAADPSRARLGRLAVQPGEWLIDADSAEVITYFPQETGVPGLTLEGWSLPEITWRAGENVTLELLWMGDGVMSTEPLVATIYLTDDSGAKVTEHMITIGDSYPTTLWRAQELVRDKVMWRLPAAVDSGIYPVWLDIDSTTIPLGEWQIAAPPRTFEQPEIDNVSDFTVEFARLFGYSLSETAVSPGQSVELELVWQSVTETPTSYRVFVHVLDENGNLITQSDAIPDNWTRPTTGWVSGEYIQDRHTLSLPSDAAPGAYSLVVGFYETITGSRLGEAEIGVLTVGDG